MKNLEAWLDINSIQNYAGLVMLNETEFLNKRSALIDIESCKS